MQPRDFDIGRLFWRIREAVVVADADAERVVLWNPAAEALFGYSAAEALELPLERLVPERLRDRYRAGLARYRATGHGPVTDAQLPLEVPALRKTGEEVTIELTLSPIEPATGEGRFVLAVIREVTERKRADEERERRIGEEAARAEAETARRHAAEDVARLEGVGETLRRSRDQMEIILGGVADGITAQDATGRLVYANPAAVRMLGFPSAEALLATPIEDVMRTFEVLDEVGRPFPLDRFPARLALRGQESPEAILRFRVTATGEERWATIKATPVLDERGQVRLAITIFRDITRRRRAEEAQRFLAEASTLLAGSLDYETTLAVVARLAVPRFADWCAVDVIEEGGAIRRLATTHVDPAKVELSRELERRYPTDPNAERGVPNVLRTGQLELYPEIPDSLLEASARDAEHLRIMRELGLKSAMVVPMLARRRTLGAITFVSAESGRRYGPQDVAVAEDLARRAALAVDNARLYREAQGAVHERDRALAAAEAERDRLQQVLDVLPEAIVIVDASGRFILSNAATAEILGAELAEQSMPMAEPEAYERYGLRRLDGSPYPSQELPLQRSVLRGEVVRGEQLLARNAGDGRDVPILVSSAPLRDVDGAIVGGVATFQDITELKAMEQARDEFLSSVSHDLKSPLAAIRGFAQLGQRQAARMGGSEGERLAERLAGIVESTAKMARQLDDLLDVARLRMGRPLELERAPTDLVALVQRVVAVHQQSTEQHRIRVEAAVPELVGEWDPARLERAVDNLVSNAIKYSPSGGEIALRLAREGGPDGGWAVLAVRDEGMGIPAADLPRVFERFHRARNVGQISGTGIGLASVRQIVEQHSGTVEVESCEGHGATFTVRLPLAG